MVTAVILAAGSNTRMNDPLPKSLQLINKVPNVQRTLTFLRESGISDVVVVVNQQHQPAFSCITDRVFATDRTNGCGDSLLSTINDLPITSESLLLLWGDVVLTDSGIIAELLSYNSLLSKFPMILPVVKKFDPYCRVVTEIQNGYNIVQYATLNRSQQYGYHDQSIFLLHVESVRSALTNTTTVVGKELKFMQTVPQYLYDTGTPAIAYETSHNTFSYNTTDELNYIRINISNS